MSETSTRKQTTQHYSQGVTILTGCVAREKHKGQARSEPPQSSPSPWDKDAILLQDGCQVELMEKVSEGTGCQNEREAVMRLRDLTC